MPNITWLFGLQFGGNFGPWWAVCGQKDILKNVFVSWKVTLYVHSCRFIEYASAVVRDFIGLIDLEYFLFTEKHQIGFRMPLTGSLLAVLGIFIFSFKSQMASFAENPNFDVIFGLLFLPSESNYDPGLTGVHCSHTNKTACFVTSYII